MSNLIFATGLFVIGVLITIIFPFMVIWSLNMLFNLSIDYTFWNWVAVCVLMVFFNTQIINDKK